MNINYQKQKEIKFHKVKIQNFNKAKKSNIMKSKNLIINETQKPNGKEKTKLKNSYLNNLINNLTEQNSLFQNRNLFKSPKRLRSTLKISNIRYISKKSTNELPNFKNRNKRYSLNSPLDIFTNNLGESNPLFDKKYSNSPKRLRFSNKFLKLKSRDFLSKKTLKNYDEEEKNEKRIEFLKNNKYLIKKFSLNNNNKSCKSLKTNNKLSNKLIKISKKTNDIDISENEKDNNYHIKDNDYHKNDKENKIMIWNNNFQINKDDKKLKNKEVIQNVEKNEKNIKNVNIFKSKIFCCLNVNDDN